MPSNLLSCLLVRINTYDNDELLMQDFRNGNEDAFAVIYKRFHRSLYFFALRFIAADDAQDIVAEAFEKLWHQRASFSAIAPVQQWLFVTVRNRCLTQLKRISKQQEVNADLFHLLESSEEVELYREELATELIALLHHQINQLPERQKEVFLLSFRDGLKPAQIAERLSLSVQTVKNQKLSALRVLQAALGHRAILLSIIVLLYEEPAIAIPV